MFKHNEKLRTTIKELMAFAKSLNRGDVLKFEDIERISGQVRYNAHWSAIITKFRKVLRNERGIAVRPVINVGYRLCTVTEQLTECPKDRQRRAVRQLNRGVKEVDVLETEKLSDHQRQLRAMTLQHLIAERRAVKRGIRHQHQEIRRTETMPIPKR